MSAKHTGGCHCGNIALEIEITSELKSYSPRICNCDFCIKHGASYLSDNNGKLTIYIKNQNDLNKYKHGDKIADFIICKTCGVLIGVFYENKESLYAAINSKAIDKNFHLQPGVIVSPKMLNGHEKIYRWKSSWFSDVNLKLGRV